MTPPTNLRSFHPTGSVEPTLDTPMMTFPATQSEAMALRTIPPRLKPAQQSRAKRIDTAGGANKAHYQSAAHDAWAKAVKDRDGHRCVKCGAAGPRLTADHIIEVKDGGAKLDVANGQTICLPCSNTKTAQARRERQR
ncbi:HNH endonuclease [Methylosinus sporium]